jgi:acyl-CoA synthetase (NDP forming)
MKEQSQLRRIKVPDLEYIFHPKSIAIVGASRTPPNPVNHFYLDSLTRFGYEGKIYPIHPNASELSGFKAYPSIMDIPGPIDHVICAIKASLTPQLMRECVAKRVKLVQLFTSGFSETGKEEGIRLEKEIVEIARQGGVRVLGPNCMGIYCPDAKISYEAFLPRESGSVGLLCQSGGNSMELIYLGGARGVRFSKAVSFGNASDINEAELLEYFAHDSQTKIIGGYIEGTRDGRRFIKALQKAAEAKPVIMLKGGVTEAGTKAATSHTGALAGNNVIWESLFHQLGVRQVDDLPEMVDLILLFLHLKPLTGRKAGLIGLGGGCSVLATDICVREGLTVAPFPLELREKLREIIPDEFDPGTSMRNPVDVSASGWNPDIFSKTLETIANYNGIDFVLTYEPVPTGPGASRLINTHIDYLIQTKKRVNKPIATVLRRDDTPEAANLAFNLQNKCAQAGIPVFPSLERAARAINRFVEYHEQRR